MKTLLIDKSALARLARCSPDQNHDPFDGYHSARRGTYRIIYRINEEKHTVEIHSIRHRRRIPRLTREACS